MQEIKNFYFSDEAILEDLGNGIRRKILAFHHNLMAVEVHFEERAIGTVHSHPHEQITYVLEGAFEFEIDGQKHAIRSGDSTYIQPNVPHGTVCLEKGILLDIFTPHREDFILEEKI